MFFFTLEGVNLTIQIGLKNPDMKPVGNLAI